MARLSCRLGDQRVEWMYQGGFAAQEDAEKRQEEYLLGKTVDKLPEQAGQEEAAARVHVLLSLRSCRRKSVPNDPCH